MTVEARRRPSFLMPFHPLVIGHLECHRRYTPRLTGFGELLTNMSEHICQSFDLTASDHGMLFKIFLEVFLPVFPQNTDTATSFSIGAVDDLFGADILMHREVFTEDFHVASGIGTLNFNLWTYVGVGQHILMSDGLVTNCTCLHSFRTLTTQMFIEASFDDLFPTPIWALHFYEMTIMFAMCFVVFHTPRPVASLVFVLTGDLQSLDVARASKIAEYLGRRLATVGAPAHPSVDLRDTRLTEDLAATLDLVSFSNDMVAYHAH